jgi:cell division septum initiation protein DivIVA
MQPGEEIQNLVEELEAVIENSKVPFGGGNNKRVVDTQEIYNILDDIRDVFPEEFSNARRILKERDEILIHAQQQADSIVADAQQQAAIIASDQEIVRLAQQQADDIRDQAQQYERDTRYNAEEYAENVLAHLEDNLKSITGQVTRCRQTLSESSGPRLGGWQN